VGPYRNRGARTCPIRFDPWSEDQHLKNTQSPAQCARYSLGGRLDSPDPATISIPEHLNGRACQPFSASSRWSTGPDLASQRVSRRKHRGHRRPWRIAAGVNADRPRGAAPSATRKEPRPGGLEPPTYGLEIRSGEKTTQGQSNTYESVESELTPQLTPESRKRVRINGSDLPPDLAEIVKAWSRLAEATRSAIVAIVRAAVGEAER